MAKARVLFSNLTLAASTTLAASASATGYAVTNLKNHKRHLPWRSDAATGNQTVTVTFSVADIVAVVLIDPVIHAGGSVKVELKNGGGAYADFGGGSGVFTIPSPHRTGLVAKWNTAGVTATDARITFTNTGAVAAAVELGGLWVVTEDGIFVATINLTDNLGLEVVDPSVESVALGGQQEFDSRDPFDRYGVEFVWLPAAQKDELLAITDAIGRHTPAVFALDPDDDNFTILARLQKAGQLRHATRDQWHVSLDLQEAL